MAWTYILECADGSFYVGSTIDLERRISQHNLGEGASYTKPRRRRPVRLAWAADFARVDDAFFYEKRIRKWSRAKRIALIEGRYDDLPALARGRNRETARRASGGVGRFRGLDDARRSFLAPGCSTTGSVARRAARRAPVVEHASASERLETHRPRPARSSQAAADAERDEPP